MAEFTPFADEAAAITIGGMTIENGTGRVAISGSLDMTRDAAGRDKVEALKAVVDAMHRAIAADPHSAGRDEAAVTRTTRKNPFA